MGEAFAQEWDLTQAIKYKTNFIYFIYLPFHLCKYYLHYLKIVREFYLEL